jgi:hypothetical protein
LALADNGMGILKSFREAGLPWSFDLDDPAAITKALEPRVSSKGSPNNEGVGLTLVAGLSRLTRAWLLIVSGRGVLSIKPDGVVESSLLPEDGCYQGTLITLTFKQDRVRDFAEMLYVAKVEAGLLQTTEIGGRFKP